MAAKKKVTVKIKAKEYVINCTEEEEYVQKIAYYVDRKLKQIETANPILSSDTTAILTAVNITDELLRAMEVIERLKKRIPNEDKELKKYADNFYNEKSEEFVIKEVDAE
ncbi:MAG: cell division protein ZapA [Clostridiales bacterium]|nr:cell division protein ZapA [Clostridiales bacterium]